MALTLKEFRELLHREQAERRRNYLKPYEWDWLDELGDEIDRHPIVSPYVKRSAP